MGYKILFLSHNFYPFIGGIEINSEILAVAFSNAGHEVRLATWTADQNASRTFPFILVRNPSKAELLKLHNWADLVFENNPCLRLSWPNLLFKKPVVVALNTWVAKIDGKRGFQEKIKSLWLKRATGVIAVSDAVKKHSWPAAIVIRNPYREYLFRIVPQIERSSDFVFLGRLVSDKGADIAIEALHKIIQKSPLFKKTTLTIIGQGPEQNNLKNLAASLAIEKHIIFAGALVGESLVECLNRHKFIIVPSKWEEPFGNVALEGMACGCIPIVSNGGGLPEAIGKAGITFTKGDVDSLVSAIEFITSQPKIAENLKMLATDHLKDHFTDVVTSRYLEEIKKAV